MKTNSDEPPPRRRGTRAATRGRLVAATVDLLRSGGEGAVTTVSVTRGGGVVQSAFYQHFPNVVACLAAAAEEMTAVLREAVAAARRRMYAAGPGVGEDLERFYREVFALADAHRPTVELFLRYRSDPLALDGVLYRFAGDLRADLARDLAEQAVRAGIGGLPPGWTAALACNLMGASFAALEVWLAGEGPRVEEAARVLAGFSTGACVGVIQAAHAATR